MRKKIIKVCVKDEPFVCDFCLHFLFFRNKDGYGIDGTGYCGLHRKITDAGSECKDFYCEIQWRRNQLKARKRKED